MALPPPPTPDQLADAGIQLDAPPPSGISNFSDDELNALAHPDLGHMSDEELQAIASGHGERKDLSHLSDEELQKIANPPKSATPGQMTHAFLNPINKAIMAPMRAGAWGMNKVLTGLGAQAADNPDIEDTLKRNLWPDVPNTTGTRIASKAGEMVPDTALLMGTMGAAAPEIMGANASETAAPRLMGALQDTIKHYTASPGALMTDATMGAGLTGAGAGAGREMTKGTPYEALGETLGGLGGSAMTSVPSAASTYWKYGIYPNLVKFPLNVGKGVLLQNMPSSWAEGEGAIPSILRSMKDNYTEMLNKKAMPLASKMYGSIMTPEAGDSLQKAQQLRTAIPGFDPTMGEATGIPSLMATQKGVEAGSSGNVLDNFVARKQTSQDAIRNYTEQQTPVTNASDNSDAGQQLVDAVQRRVGQTQQPLDTQAASVQALREGQAASLPQSKPYDTGGYMRERLEALRGSKQGEMAKLADDMGLNSATNLRVSAPAIQRVVNSALPSRFAANTSPTMRTIAKLPSGEPLTFADAKYFMENLGGEARLAAKQGNANDARIITDARGKIDDYLKDEWAPALNIGDKYAAFRDRYLKEYVQPFETGTAKDVKSLGGDQAFRTDNEDVASKFWRPGGETEARDFNRTFAGDPKALDAMQAHILDDVRSSAVKDGVIDPIKLNKWITANPQLSQFPSLQKQVTDMHALASNLAQRQATLTARQDMVANTDLSKMLSEKGVTIDGLLQDKAGFGRVIQGATPVEKATMARQIYQRAAQGADQDPAAMRQFLDDHADILPKLLTKDHIDALNNIQKAWEMDARAPTPTGRPVDPETAALNLKGMIGSSPQQVLSRAFAVESGRTGIKYTLGDMLARAGLTLKARQAQSMMDRAMYDSNFAKQLSDFVAAQNAPKPEKLTKLKAALFATGISGIQDQAEDQQTPHITVHPRPGYYNGQNPPQNGNILQNFQQGGQQ